MSIVAGSGNAGQFLTTRPAVVSANIIDVHPAQHGEDKAAEINLALTEIARLSTGGAVQLFPGRYPLTSPIIVPVSSQKLTLAGSDRRTILVPSFVGAVDDMANAAVLAAGAPDTATLSTVLTVNAERGQSSIVVASAGTIRAGMYIAVDTNPAPAASNPWILNRVAGSYVSGLTIPLEWPLEATILAIVSRVRRWLPVADVRLEEMSVECGAGLVAVGFSVLGAVGAELTGLEGSGCTRALTEIDQGSLDFKVVDLHSLGANNSLCIVNAAGEGVVQRVRCDRSGERDTALGWVRHGLVVSGQSNAIKISDIDVARMCGGIRVADGAKGISVARVNIRDVDGTRLLADGILNGESQAGERLGIGVATGYGPIPLAAFCHDVDFQSIHVEDATTPSSSVSFAWHDLKKASLRGAKIVNLGLPLSGAGSRQMRGFFLNDVLMGTIEGLEVGGVDQAIMTENTPENVLFSGTILDGGTISGPAGLVGIRLGHSSNNSQLRFVGLKILNYAVRWSAIAGFADDTIEVRDYHTEAYSASLLMLFQNLSGVSFADHDVVGMLTGAAPRRITTPAAGAPGCLSVSPGCVQDGQVAGRGILWCGGLEGLHYVMANGVLTRGQLVEVNGARRAVLSAVLDQTAWGQVMGDKGAGDGVIQVCKT